MSSDEKFYCLACKELDTLNINLRCAHCGSDRVVSSMRILGTLSEAEVQKLHDIITKPEPSRLSQHFWHIEYQDFETMVSSLDAQSEESATKFALTNKLQPWYSTGITSPDLGLKCEVVTRDAWCEWVRSKN